MKRSRPLSLFLSVLILISCFTVSVSAESSGNLIESDFREWALLESSSTSTSDVLFQNNIYWFSTKSESISDTGLFLKSTFFYDLADMTAGHSYTFTFHLCSLEELRNYVFSGITENGVINNLVNNGGYYVIGLCSYNSKIDNLEFVEDCCIIIDGSNCFDYMGKTSKITFELPNIVNPCITITYLEASPTNFAQYTGLKDLSLVDNDEAEEDGFFDRLFQFFHDLKWEIVGGSCNDGCSKSPHTSLAEKISTKFQEGLDNLKQFFHDLKWDVTGGTCDKEDCSKKVHTSLAGRINTHIDDLGENIEEFFGGFGNLILYFNWDGEYTNPFEREDSPIDKVSEFFDDLIEYVDSIGTSIENILDSITGGLHIFDEFTSRFPWLKGIAMFCLAIIVLSRFIGL